MLLLSYGNKVVAGEKLMSVVVMVALLGAATTTVGVLGFYLLCAYVVRATGSTSGLRDVAVAIRAFRGRGASARVEQSGGVGDRR